MEFWLVRFRSRGCPHTSERLQNPQGQEHWSSCKEFGLQSVGDDPIKIREKSIRANASELQCFIEGLDAEFPQLPKLSSDPDDSNMRVTWYFRGSEMSCLTD